MTIEYDNACAKFFNKLKIVNLPLVSWGVFSKENLDSYHFNKIQENWITEESFINATVESKKEVLITDVNFNIIFASKGIFQITGYQPAELIGKSPKIFQGLKTNDKSRTAIRNAIKSKLPFKEILLNYKKNGSTYKCEIEGIPKFNKEGKFVNYIAFERIAA